jgi:hypothetical protein
VARICDQTNKTSILKEGVLQANENPRIHFFRSTQEEFRVRAVFVAAAKTLRPKQEN